MHHLLTKYGHSLLPILHVALTINRGNQPSYTFCIVSLITSWCTGAHFTAHPLSFTARCWNLALDSEQQTANQCTAPLPIDLYGATTRNAQWVTAVWINKQDSLQGFDGLLLEGASRDEVIWCYSRGDQWIILIGFSSWVIHDGATVMHQPGRGQGSGCFIWTFSKRESQILLFWNEYR